MTLLHAITRHILELGGLGVFIGMFFESAYIPLPSEVILPYAGFLVASGRITMFNAVIMGLVGSLLGAWVAYELARWGGRPLVQHYGRYVGIRAHELDRADHWFQRHGDGAVFFGRLLPGIRTFISLPAGIAKMARGRFLLFSLLGALPWTILFTYAGYLLGRNWNHLPPQAHWFALAAIVLAIIWVATLVWRGRAKSRPR